MFDWPKKVNKRSPTAAAALSALTHLNSADEVEEVWDQMDQVTDEIWDDVVSAIQDGMLTSEQSKCALIWCGYTQSNRGQPLGVPVREALVALSVWALSHEANNVLIGGALACLDALQGDEREAVAIEIFREAGPHSARKYWLLLKVRTEAMLREVANSFDSVDLLDQAKINGAFRQFKSEDLAVLRRVAAETPHRLFDIAIEAAQKDRMSL